MTALVLSCCVLAPGAPLPTKGGVEVLASSADYRKLAIAETTTEGTLERVPAGAARWSYRLKFGPRVSYLMIHAPGKAHLLEPFVGKRVWATGKIERVEPKIPAAGQLWLARIDSQRLPPTSDGRGVLARCSWHPSSALPLGATHAVIKNGTDLARLMRIRGESAGETATALMSARLGVTGIDWKKHMLVSLSAGLKADVDRLTVTSATVRDGALTVAYRLSPAPRGGGFGYPVETVLVDRFEGTVRISPAPPAPREKKLRPSADRQP